MSSSESFPFAAVLFDMDGVLVDTEAASDAFHIHLCSQLGATVTHEEMAGYRGSTGRLLWQGLMARHSFPHDIETLMQMAREGFWAYLQASPDFRPLPGVEPLLSALRRQGVHTAVCTMASRFRLQNTLAHFGWEQTFDVTLAIDDVAQPKPAPDVYLLAAERLGVPIARCLVIEDSERGIQAAVASGAKCLRYTALVPDPHETHQAHGRLAQFLGTAPAHLVAALGM